MCGRDFVLVELRKRMNKPKKCSRDSAPRPAPVWTVSRRRIPQCEPARTPPAPVCSALYSEWPLTMLKYPALWLSEHSLTAWPYSRQETEDGSWLIPCSLEASVGSVWYKALYHQSTVVCHCCCYHVCVSLATLHWREVPRETRNDNKTVTSDYS